MDLVSGVDRAAPSDHPVRATARQRPAHRGLRLRRQGHHGATCSPTLGTVTVVPAGTSAADVLALEPDGVFLSNGPGDPAALPGPDRRRGRPGGAGARSSASAWATSCWPPRWAARPTSCPSATTGPTTRCSAWRPAWWRSPARTTTTPWPPAPCPTPRSTHVNLNDGVIEGIRSLKAPAFSVQYHPEAAPGPHDARYLFGAFRDLMLAHPGAGRPAPGRAAR